jgi:hypothetical protein
MTKVDITATRQAPRAYIPIGMAAHVVALLSRGGLRERLANNHELDVPAARGRQTDISLLGDVGLAADACSQLSCLKIRSCLIRGDQD